MTQRLIALAAAATFGLSSVAQAGPVPLASADVVKASASAAPVPSAWVDPPRSSAPGKADLSKSDAGKAAALPAPGKSASAAPLDGSGSGSATPDARPPEAKAPAAPPKFSVEGKPAAQDSEGAARDVPPSRKPSYRATRYAGGEGASWKTGRNAYGFSGTYGGCRFTGFAGPNGYRLNRVC